MKKFVLMCLAALSVSGALAITATKEYVDRSTNAVLVAAKAETAAATNATLAAAKAYTDAEIEKAGSVTPGAVTNIAGVVTSNVVTKAYVEGLCIDAGINETTATNISYSVVSNSVQSGYLCTVEAAQEMTNVNDIVRYDSNGETGQKLKHGDTAITASDVGAKEANWLPQNLYCDDGSVAVSVNDVEVSLKSGLYLNTPGGINAGTYVSANEGFLGSVHIGSTTYGTTSISCNGVLYNLPTDGGGGMLALNWQIPSVEGFINAQTATNIAEDINSTTRAIVETWEGFLDGSNVVFSITNYISGSYNPNTAKLKILEMTNGVYREVYNSRDEIRLHLDGFRTNEFVSATNAIVSAVDANVANKADRDWGKYTSAGGVAPSNTVYMTAPSTVFAGGLEYERVAVGEGMVGILTTKGAPTYTTGDEGTFKFQDDGGTNYFGFAKTDSYVIGCDTDGISVQNHIVTLTYNVTMSGVPCIWYCPTLDVKPLVWEQLNTPDGQPIAGASHTVTWEASPAAGTEVCYLNCPESKGFFKATIEVAGSAKFMTNMPADLGGGIMCTNTATGVTGIIRPSFNGSSVTWSWSNL